ncbi:hypothetical protein CRE_23457 [Caenorhabditis remanei]|uniref:F-box domain-containing protein n=1 Tax=Caenorhabditis remanei TaxID=31234 RepID=E3MGU3_CAERE|nr:hypothetical protein CRE_23457 [Caenorhabditis remanei]
MSLFNLFSCCLRSRPKSPKKDVPKEEHAFLLDMPDVFTNQILKNLDFATIRKLRKVCHALRDFIDCAKPDSNLKSINLKVRANKIFVLLSTPSSTKAIEFSYKEHEHQCLMQRGRRFAMFDKNCVDLCVDDFLWPALKHQKSLLDELYLTRQLEFGENNQSIPQTPGKLLVPIFGKLFDSLINVLKSRDQLLKVENLMISLTGQYQLMQLLRHVDLKALKRLALVRLSETEKLMDDREDNSEFGLDLDILKNCKNLVELHVKRFSISSPLRMLAHIRTWRLTCKQFTVKIYYISFRPWKNQTTVLSH